MPHLSYNAFWGASKVGNEIILNGGNFESEVLHSNIPVLIDFWAPWCGPCKMIAPFLEQIANEYAGRVKVGKINIDEEADLANQHSIASIPALMLYNNGTIVNQRVGASPKHDIESMLRDYV